MVAGFRPNGLVVVVVPNMVDVGWATPKIELVAGAVDAAMPKGLVVAAAGAPNILVGAVAAVFVANENGAADVAKRERRDRVVRELRSEGRISYEMSSMSSLDWHRKYSTWSMRWVSRKMELQRKEFTLRAIRQVIGRSAAGER